MAFVRYTGKSISLLETVKVVCNEKIGGSSGASVDSFEHGLINYIDTKAKCRHIEKLTCKGTLRKIYTL